MSNALAARENTDLSIMEQVIIKGDLAQLQPQERVQYYNALCQSVGLNPLSRPFEYIELSGKLTLYARKDAGDQLRQTRHVKITRIEKELVDDVYVVTAYAEMPDGRTDSDSGAVPLVKEGGDWKTSSSGKKYFQGNGTYTKLAPEDRANAMMKAITKAKRRVTLSICGLGFLDETEVKDIPQARTIVVNESGEIVSDTNEATAPTPQPTSRVKVSRAGMEKRIKELFTQANALELKNPEQWYDAVLEDMTDDEVLDFGKRFAAAIKDARNLAHEAETVASLS